MSSAVPYDPNMSPEVRAFLDSQARKKSFSELNVSDFTADTIEASVSVDAPAITEDGAEVLTVAGNKTIVGGFLETEFDLGTQSSGSVQINPSVALKQTLINNGSFTLTATTQIGDCELRLVNGASAGTVTFSGFDKKWPGDALDTTSGHQFIIFIYGFNGKRAYLIKALQ